MGPWRVLQGTMKKFGLAGICVLYLSSILVVLNISYFRIAEESSQNLDLESIKSEHSCLLSKFAISSNVSVVIPDLKCSILTNIASKTENECREEDAQNKELFQYTQFQKRMLLSTKKYFQKIRTVAFQKKSQYENFIPLAFSIVIHDQLGQFEALLATIFRPHNSYCLYVDAKTQPDFKQGVHQLVQKYKDSFPEANIFLVPNPKAIFWGDKSLLNADITCMKLLLDSDQNQKKMNPNTKLWKFYLNLAGTVMPQTSVAEMARHLFNFQNKRAPPYDSIESSDKDMHWFDARYKFKFYLDEGQYNKTKKITYEDASFNYAARPSTNYEPKTPPPYNLTIFKGYREAILSRETCTFMTNSELATNFLDWLQDAYVPEEFFFATLSRVVMDDYRHNKSVVQQVSPTFDTERGLCNRLSLWTFENPTCHGALADLPNAYSFKSCFFLNKFDLEVDPLPVTCLYEHWTKESKRKYFFNKLIGGAFG